MVTQIMVMVEALHELLSFVEIQQSITTMKNEMMVTRTMEMVEPQDE